MARRSALVQTYPASIRRNAVPGGSGTGIEHDTGRNQSLARPCLPVPPVPPVLPARTRRRDVLARTDAAAPARGQMSGYPGVAGASRLAAGRMPSRERREPATAMAASSKGGRYISASQLLVIATGSGTYAVSRASTRATG